MLSQEFLKILACPGCKGDLIYQKQENKLICPKCRLKFKVQEDIPIMLLDQAERF